MRKLLSRFLNDCSGATAVEYCLIATGIGMAVVAVVNGIGSNISSKLTTAGTALK